MSRPEISISRILVLLFSLSGFHFPASATGLGKTSDPIYDSVAIQTNQFQQVSSKMNEKSDAINKAVELATSDLGKQLGHSDFTVTQTNAVTWPDASAGCAVPGFSYPQVLTPGYLIVFTSGGRTYRYTGSLRSSPRLCPASRFRPPLETNSDA
jgi:hypothetical protein